MKTKTKATKKRELTLKEYFDSIDFAEWWEEFATSFQKNGTFKYPTVYSFTKSKAKSKRHKDFLWWVLGPKVELHKDEVIGHKEFESFPQYDWADKREIGFWYSSKNTEAIKKEAQRSFSAMDEVRAIGKLNLDDVGRLKTVIDQLDREYAGQLQLSNLSAKENILRVETYISLRSKFQDLLHRAQVMYAKTRGVDMSQLDSLLAITGSSILGTIAGKAQDDPAQTKKLGIIDSLNQMMLSKANAYRMDLPDKDAETIIKDMGKLVVLDKKKVQ